MSSIIRFGLPIKFRYRRFGSPFRFYTRATNIPVIEINQLWTQTHEMVKHKFKTSCVQCYYPLFRIEKNKRSACVHLHFGTPYVGQIKESPNHPLLQKILFSWIFDGRCTQTLSQSKAQQHVIIQTPIASLKKAISKF